MSAVMEIQLYYTFMVFDNQIEKVSIHHSPTSLLLSQLSLTSFISTHLPLLPFFSHHTACITRDVSHWIRLYSMSRFILPILYYQHHFIFYFQPDYHSLLASNTIHYCYSLIFIHFHCYSLLSLSLSFMCMHAILLISHTHTFIQT